MTKSPPYVKALISEEQKKALKLMALQRDVDMQDMCRDAILGLLSSAAPSSINQPAIRSAGSAPYRPENLPWHDRLELVLNDPDEKIGIQKNLEWAEHSVRSKVPKKLSKRA